MIIPNKRLNKLKEELNYRHRELLAALNGRKLPEEHKYHDTAKELDKDTLSLAIADFKTICSEIAKLK